MDLPVIESLDWQTLAAIACVIAAAAVVAKRALGWMTGSAHSGCGNCPANPSKPIVPIDSLKLSDSLKQRTSEHNGKR